MFKERLKSFIKQFSVLFITRDFKINYKKIIDIFKIKIFYIPFIILVFSILIFSAILFFGNNIPHIKYINPEIGAPGDTIEIYGKNFTDDRIGGIVYFSDIKVAATELVSWSDEKIVLKIPEEVSVGLVYVKTRYGESNEKFWTNSNFVPKVVNEKADLSPTIKSVNLSTVYYGDTLTLLGENFFYNSLMNKLFLADENLTYQLDKNSKEIIVWNENEISFAVPQFTKNEFILFVRNQYSDSKKIAIKYKSSATRKFGEPLTYNFNVSCAVSNTFDKTILYSYFFPLPQDKQRNVILKNKKVNDAFDVITQTKSIRSNKTVVINYDYKIDSKDLFVELLDNKNYLYNESLEKKLPKLPFTLPRNFMERDIYQFRTGQINVDSFVKLATKSIKEFFLVASFKYTTKEFALLFEYICKRVSIDCKTIEGIYINSDNNIESIFWNQYLYQGYGYIDIDCSSSVYRTKDEFMKKNDFVNCISSRYINFHYENNELPKSFAEGEFIDYDLDWTNLNYFIECQNSNNKFKINRIKFLYNN